MLDEAQGVPRTCLVVDDEESICQTIGYALEPQNWKVRSCLNYEAALQAFKEEPYDLAMIDLRLGERSGLDLLPPLQQSQPGIPVVIITAYSSIPSAVEAMRRGALDYLPKPFNPQELRRAVSQTMAAGLHQRLQSDLDRGLVMVSRVPSMQRVLEQANKVARSEVAVLILGETGTGKGVLAKAIHSESRRKGGPFVVLACPSLSDGLLESELFGHEKGAFTGAYREHNGRLAQARGGTLFLDEVGDMPLSLQTKLLRVLQSKEYERIGGSETLVADVRIMAATHVDLPAAVKEGRFREDLYYRLSGLELVMPPLRERLDDLEALAEGMLASLRAEAGRGPRTISREALAAFRRYVWPGNLREMHNVLERACVLGEHMDVRLADLPAALRPKPKTPAKAAVEPEPPGLVSIEEVEVAHIKKVLAATPSLDVAARILGIDGATLWRRRKKYNL